MPQPTVVGIRFNGSVHNVRLDRDGRLNLADIHSASGVSRNNRTPAMFMRNQQTIDLMEELNQYADLHSEIINRVNGGIGRGTWVDRRIAFAYAAWLSAEFHRAVLETFDAAARGEGEVAVETAQNAVRLGGIETRKRFASAAGKRGVRGRGYAHITNDVYAGVFGSDAATLRRERGLREKANLRDHLNDDELLRIDIAESLVTLELMRGAGTNPITRNQDVIKGLSRFNRALQ